MQINLVDVLAWAPTTILFLYVAWNKSRWSRPGWFKMLNPVAFWLFLPWLLVSLALLRLDPSLARALATLVTTGLFSGHFLWSAIPHRTPAADVADSSLRVMTVNLFKRNESVKEIIDAILAEAPDVVAMQELKESHLRAVKQWLGETYPYQMLCPGLESEGMGLVSRRPFQSAETRTLTPGANATQIASITSHSRRLWILNMHPRIPHLQTVHLAGVSVPVGLRSQERQRDIKAILEVATELEGDAILLGDMNTTSQCEEYQLIPSYWQNSHTYAGWGLGLTYPVDEPFFGVPLPFPLFRIDHIFYRGKLEAVTCHTGRMPGSDHRYLVADLREIN
jgi:endonuclease/exonuclease/phosphatase (EEP) superfamily protein YafD